MSNGHIIHPEELVLMGDFAAAIESLKGLRIFSENLVRHKFAEQHNFPRVTVKWDGSPSIFVGRDLDSTFFVATKRFLNKTKKIVYQSADEIMNSLEYDDVKAKLLTLFKEFKDFDIAKGVAYQGDLIMHDGNMCMEPNGNVTVMGNILRYSFPPSHDLHGKIVRASAVVAWHTKHVCVGKVWYSNPIPQVAIDKLTKHPSVVCLYRKLPKEFHYSTTVFDTNHYDIITSVSMIESRLSYLQHQGLEKYFESLSKYLISYTNHMLKTNSFLPTPVHGLLTRFKYWFLKTVESERDKGRIGAVKYKMYTDENFLKPLMESVICPFEVVDLYFKYKRAILGAFNKVYSNEIFISIQDKDGRTSPFEHEGLVLDGTVARPLKIVDRQRFSVVNFDDATARAFKL